MANRSAAVEKDQMRKLSSLLGGYVHAQKRIEFDYAAVLFQPESELPVSLLSPLVKRACEIHDTVAAWELDTHNKRPSEYLTALARKAYYAVGYIVRRFQGDETLRAGFHTYKPHLDVIEAYLQQILTELGSEGAGDDEAKRLENDLEDVFAKLMFTRGQIMCGLLERTIAHAMKEKEGNTGESMESSRSDVKNSHPNDGPVYHQQSANDSRYSIGKEKEFAGHSTEIIDSHSMANFPSPKGSVGHLQTDILRVDQYGKLEPMYDIEAGDPPAKPHSTTSNHPPNVYHIVERSSGFTSTSAFTAQASNISRINSTGYMKTGEASVAPAKGADLPSFFEEPEEMAPGEYNDTLIQQTHANTLSRYNQPHYDPATYSHYPPVHQYHPHQPHYSAHYPPAHYHYASHTPHGGWVYPDPLQKAPVHQSGGGVNISHSFNQIGNRTETTTTRNKTKSRTSTSKSKRSTHDE